MSSTALAIKEPASTALASFLGMDPDMMLQTFKAQCFRNANQVSDSQLAAFVSIARDMGVNPLLPGMLYAYPTTGGGIVPMMGPDGVYKKLMEHPSVDSWDTKVFPEDGSGSPTHATTNIYLKGKDHPISYTAYFSEWKVQSNPNWTTRPRHMLGLRSLKQAARQVIHGLPYDEDDKVIGDLINVTPASEGSGPVEQRKEPPARSKKGVAAAVENAKTENATVNVETTVVPEKEKPAEKAAEKVEDKQAPAANEKPTAVVIEDAKTVTIEGLRIVSAETKVVNGKPNSVQATVEGPTYSGTVYHFSGGGPAWESKDPVTLTITGKKLKDGRIVPLVDSIKLAAPEGEEDFN